MANEVIKLELTGKVGYEDEISATQAAEIIAFLNDAAAPLRNPPSGAIQKEVGSGARSAGPRAALDATGAKTNPQKIVALARYVLQDGGETFNIDAVKVQFQRAREPMPKNMSRDLGLAIAAGWIEESEEGEYYLTNEAYKALQNGFKDKRSTPQRNRSRGSAVRSRGSGKAGKTPRAAKPEVFAGIDEFHTTMDGYPGYHDMKANKDKLLWAVQYAKAKGISGLSNQAIAWLTDHLGDGVPAKQITAAFNSAKKGGLATRSTMDSTIRIVPKGQEYLARVAKPD